MSTLRERIVAKAAEQQQLQKVAFAPAPGAGAPPMDPMAGGMPPAGMDPMAMMGGAPPMDPSMMPPMDPSMMPPDPAMMGGAPPMDPAAMGLPPMPPAGMPSDPSMMGPMPEMSAEEAMAGGIPLDPTIAATEEAGAPVTADEVRDIIREELATGKSSDEELMARMEELEAENAKLREASGTQPEAPTT